MDTTKKTSFPSLEMFFQDLFEVELKEEAIYDSSIVALIKEHLGQGSIHSRAGNRLADALISLAKERSKEATK